jgi:hypothetical protein
MPVTNNNVKLLDLPMWEVLQPFPAAAGAGVCSVYDRRGSERFAYTMFATFSYWRYDLWANTWQQLASAPGGTFGTGTAMVYDPSYTTLATVVATGGGSTGGFLQAGVYFVRYSYVTADGESLACTPSASFTVASGNIPRVTLPNITTLAGVTSMNIYLTAAGGAAGTETLYASGVTATTKDLTTAQSAGAALPTTNTSGLPTGGVWALIAAATAPLFYVYDCVSNLWSAAKSVTNLPATVGTDTALNHTEPLYSTGGNDDYIYFSGNASTSFVRYSISANTWTALTAIPGATGAGVGVHWITGFDTNSLFVIRGGATATIYRYSISGNSWGTPVINPITEAFTTGTMSCIKCNTRDVIYIQKDTTSRCLVFDPAINQITPLCTQYLVAVGGAVTGDRFFTAVDPTYGIPFLYIGVHSTTNFLRTPLIF